MSQLITAASIASQCTMSQVTSTSTASESTVNATLTEEIVGSIQDHTQTDYLGMSLSDSALHPSSKLQESGHSNTATIACAASGALIIFLLQVIVFVVLILGFVQKRKMASDKVDIFSTQYQPTNYKGKSIRCFT